jgi:hypothetical protein
MEVKMAKQNSATLRISVKEKSGVPISNARVFVDDQARGRTDSAGLLLLDQSELTEGKHKITAKAFGKDDSREVEIPTRDTISMELDLNLKCEARTEDGREEISYCRAGQVVELRAEMDEYTGHQYAYSWEVDYGKLLELDAKQKQRVVHLDTTETQGQAITAKVIIEDKSEDEPGAGASVSSSAIINVRANGSHAIADQVQRTVGNVADKLGGDVALKQTRRKGTPDILTWQMIKKSTDALSFNHYKAFMDYVLCNDDEALMKLDPAEQGKVKGPKTEKNASLRGKRFLPYTDTEAYRLLKVATEAFLIVNCGILLEDFISDDVYQQLLGALDAEDASGQTAETFWQQFLLAVNGQESYVLPYLLLIRNKLPDARIKRQIFAEEPFNAREAERCYGILAEKLLQPCMVELIWSYWHEEGMLVQTMNAISRRFQNVRGPADRDPLAMVEIDPLRPLNNLLWGYIQDDQHRLTVVRRAYEYDHHYGVSLEGKAVPALRSVDSRSRFLEAFHQMLHLASTFYKQDDDTTVIADGFAVLNALRDLHLILTEGAHNQFGDLPATARIEMLMQQWLLARPEFREYLPTRIMVAYPEPWMDRVDAMKRLQGWTDTSITHFRFLAIYGEQILLSVRFTRWSEIDDAELAAIWARFFRNQVQGYIHAYRAVTGVDLSAEITTTQQRELITTKPSVLLRQRLSDGRAAPALPAGQTATALPAPAAPTVPQGFRERRAARRLTRG